jgi:hypothetical protein
MERSETSQPTHSVCGKTFTWLPDEDVPETVATVTCTMPEGKDSSPMHVARKHYDGNARVVWPWTPEEVIANAPRRTEG